MPFLLRHTQCRVNYHIIRSLCRSIVEARCCSLTTSGKAATALSCDAMLQQVKQSAGKSMKESCNHNAALYCRVKAESYPQWALALACQLVNHGLDKPFAGAAQCCQLLKG